MKFLLKKKRGFRSKLPGSNVRTAFILSLFAFLFIAHVVNAGMTSLVGSLFGGQVSAKNTQKASYSSQNMNLPIVAVNVDPNPDKFFEDIPVLDKGTLVADLAFNSTTTEYSSKISLYTVRQGDTVSQIARMFNVSVNTILWANDINSRSLLKPGQTLLILPVTGIRYTVTKNDSISSIAKKYHSSIQEIYAYNDIESGTTLVVGQKIIIPNAETGTVISKSVVRALNGMVVPEDPLLVNISNLPSYPGYYSCPVKGVVTQGLHGRNSVDLGAPIGTPLRASADGIVTISRSSGWNGGYGVFVVISHDNNTQTLYGHMQKTLVNTNDTVKKGDIIGYVGISGMTTGPHLHFEVRGAQNPFVSIKCN